MEMNYTALLAVVKRFLYQEVENGKPLHYGTRFAIRSACGTVFNWSKIDSATMKIDFWRATAINKAAGAVRL